MRPDASGFSCRSCLPTRTRVSNSQSCFCFFLRVNPSPPPIEIPRLFFHSPPGRLPCARASVLRALWRRHECGQHRVRAAELSAAGDGLLEGSPGGRVQVHSERKGDRGRCGRVQGQSAQLCDFRARGECGRAFGACFCGNSRLSKKQHCIVLDCSYSCLCIHGGFPLFLSIISMFPHLSSHPHLSMSPPGRRHPRAARAKALH